MKDRYDIPDNKDTELYKLVYGIMTDQDARYVIEFLNNDIDLTNKQFHYFKIEVLVMDYIQHAGILELKRKMLKHLMNID